MKTSIEILGPNKTIVRLPNGVAAFFSYETVVAAYCDGKYYKTSKKFSTTTSKHVNEYLKGLEFEVVDQAWLEGLVDYVR